MEKTETVACCAEPMLRGGKCDTCGTWLSDRWPKPTTAENGLWYCYDKQAWIRDGIVERCDHPLHYESRPGCYACGHAGKQHPTCKACH